MDRGVQKGVALSLYIIIAVRFCLMAGFALFAASGRTTDMMESAAGGVEAVTALRGMCLGMFGDLPGYRGR